MKKRAFLLAFLIFGLINCSNSNNGSIDARVNSEEESSFIYSSFHYHLYFETVTKFKEIQEETAQFDLDIGLRDDISEEWWNEYLNDNDARYFGSNFLIVDSNNNIKKNYLFKTVASYSDFNGKKTINVSDDESLDISVKYNFINVKFEFNLGEFDISSGYIYFCGSLLDSEKSIIADSVDLSNVEAFPKIAFTIINNKIHFSKTN